MTMNAENRWQSSAPPERSGSSGTLVVLAAALLLCLALLGVVLRTVVYAPGIKLSLHECAAIESAADRLACFDALASRSESRPAKGGIAPKLPLASDGARP